MHHPDAKTALSIDAVSQRRRWLPLPILLCAAIGLLNQPVFAEGDVQAGKALFAQCSGCHAVGPGAKHMFGPQLNGVHSRGVATAEGYAYSDAFLERASKVPEWTEDFLDAYLEAPMEVVPGTKMAFPGVKDAESRADVVAYLKAIGADGTVAGLASAEQETVAVSPVVDEPKPLARDMPVPEHGVLHLGRPALDAEVSAWDIDIRPDGQGLPPGSGDVATGTKLYDVQCAICHGVFGEGEGRWPMLAGGFDTLTDQRPEKTIGSYWPYLSTVYDYVRRAMPFGNARSLSDDDVYALTAYLLYLNDIVDDDFVLSADTFPNVEMPNTSAFIADTRHEEEWFESSAEPCMTDCRDGVAEVSMRARVLDVTPDNEGDGDAAAGVVD